MRVLVIGESCNDVYIYGSINRLAPEAPVPVLQPRITKFVGGMSMNVFQNLKALGVHISIITNVNWEDITKTRYIDEKTNQMILRVDAHDSLYGRINLSEVDWSSYDAVIISDYDKGFVTEQDIQAITSKHSVVFLDTKKVLGEWAQDAKYIKINNIEYNNTQHTISPQLEQRLIVTLGSEGCRHLQKIYPVPLVGVKDACGAGDTFIAALTYQYMQTKEIDDAIEFANRCATQVIQKRGTSIINLNTL
tara:strand:- start:17868 stop:18614 length:747 start_codon:yes stop_codon:yes gene_type:complete